MIERIRQWANLKEIHRVMWNVENQFALENGNMGYFCRQA